MMFFVITWFGVIGITIVLPTYRRSAYVVVLMTSRDRGALDLG